MERYHRRILTDLADAGNELHDAKPPAATALLDAGEDLFVVSRILGHTSIATTAGFCGHVQPAMLRRSADRMDELMRRASGT